jgi:diguanylate cyclase (GGDEF)-like protein/PAS domain S-box-containing protein
VFTSTEFTAALFEAAPDAILVVEHGGRIARANNQAEKLFGLPKEELQQQSVEELVPDPFRNSHLSSRNTAHAATYLRSAGHLSRELFARRSDGVQIPVEITLSAVEQEGRSYTIAIVRDVTERRELEERLRYLSTHDVLTGLYNRNFFDEELARLQKGRQFPLAVLVADLDGLKQVNDAQGHAAGDELLRRTAWVLTATFRAGDIVARIGGDEFAVLVFGDDARSIDSLNQRLKVTMEANNRDGQAPVVHLSVGATFVDRGDSLSDALRQADLLMYVQKRAHHDAALP